ncbi:MAG TPA: hypothetical protein VKQ34_00345 [Candidatus Saccharimonadales bacterium]|nr:hypothetical protein [Candidatus Saccharimonadales bacterium]
MTPDTIFALDSSGNVYAQGYNGCGVIGDPAVLGNSVGSVHKIDGITGVTQLAFLNSVQYGGVIALKADGTVWSWGCTQYLGRPASDPNLSYDYIPGQVLGLPSVVKVAAGNQHVLALTAAGDVYGWGDASCGQLGIPDIFAYECGSNLDSRSTPTQIAGLSGIKDITAGARSSFAVTADGAVMQWGVFILLEGLQTPTVLVPTQVHGISDVASISAGEAVVYALKNSGDLWGWGVNDNDSLTTSPPLNQNSDWDYRPDPISVDELGGVAKMSVGYAAIFAVLNPDGIHLYGGSHSDYLGPVTFGGYNDLIDMAADPDIAVVFVILPASDSTPPSLGAFSWSANPKSTFQTSTLTVPASDDSSGVAGGEYFIGDTDPGPGNGAPMQWDGANLSTTFGTDFPTGVYKISVRAKDNAGNWSDPLSDYLVVYNPTGPRMTGKKSVVPSLANGDVLPGLTTNGQTDAATFGFSVRYDSQGNISSNSDLQFAYNTGTNCKNVKKAQNCHSLSLNASSIAWLITQGTNNSTGIFQGTATLTVDGVNSQVLFRVTGRDGTRLDGVSPDQFGIGIFMPGANPNTDTPLYVVHTTDVTRGNIRII